MQAVAPSDIFLFEGFRLDQRGGLFRRDDSGGFAPVAIGSRALDILGVLIERAGEIVSKDEIIAAVWPGTVVEDSNLTVQISALRRVLDHGGSSGGCIQTVAGHGYRFVWPVTQVVANARTARPSQSEAPSASRLSIVVLPFANLSNDPEQEYFIDAITDDLTTDLSRISGSFVIARSTAFTYKNRAVDVRQVGRELGVRYVLEGSVRLTGEQLRVNVQLVDAEIGAHLWADRFDTDRVNLAEAQNEITGRLARALNMELVKDANRRLEQQRTLDPNARDLAMRGWAAYYRPVSLASRQEAQRAFERALEIDPGSADARIGIALVLISNLGDFWSNCIRQDQGRAEQLLLEALERDAYSMAHYALGVLRRVQNRLAESKVELEMAITRDRNNAWAMLQLGQTMMFLGQPEEGASHIEKWIRLSPHDPNLHSGYAVLGLCHLLLGHLNEAIELFRKARTANPRHYYIHLLLAGALGLEGDLGGGSAALVEARRLKPEVNSIARLRVHVPWGVHPEYSGLRDKTLFVGLRRAGFPE